jgi:hypothetical protein
VHTPPTVTLPRAVVTAARHAVTELSRTMPAETAASWVHAGAVTRHAVNTGLITYRGTIPATLTALARSHPALAGLADPAVTRAWTIDPPAGLATVEQLWKQHPLPDPRGDGQLIGDLYQALSAEARKGRALCQTPPFVGRLLLDLTAADAVATFGAGALMIDPACGTGHLLTETALRLPDVIAAAGHRRPRLEDTVSRIHGADIDPYAALIARYRLLALTARAGGRTARQMPHDLGAGVIATDSLLSQREPVLDRGRYHLVLMNPPYITVRDAVLNQRIRDRYRQVCHGRYSLALPFFQLATELLTGGGYCAQLTANSFMKREFGRKFVEQYLPHLDLTWIIDTSGAYIPGHGTPTTILVHRNQAPASATVTTITSVRGEPGIPDDPAHGKVWTAIRDAVHARLPH